MKSPQQKQKSNISGEMKVLRQVKRYTKIDHIRYENITIQTNNKIEQNREK